jgi:cysteine synthase A
MSQRLANELGIAVGISSGANLLGALALGRVLGPNSVIATVFPDSNKKYLSTDLLRPEASRPEDLTPRVVFRAVRVHPRLGVAQATYAAASEPP